MVLISIGNPPSMFYPHYTVLKWLYLKYFTYYWSSSKDSGGGMIIGIGMLLVAGVLLHSMFGFEDFLPAAETKF